MKVSNPYKVLGVDAHSTDTEIKDAYRRLARRAHPDVGGTPEAFATVRAAYESTATAAQRRALAARNSMAGTICAACAGAGATRRQSRFTGVSYTTCAACEGCGYV